MKIKSKKGAVILLLASLAFLLTVFLLANYQLKTDFLGQKQTELLELSTQGESMLLYIDQMVKLSLAETWGSTHHGRNETYIFSERFKTVTDFNAGKPDFKLAFKSKFVKHLKTFNEIHEQDLKYEDFEITIIPDRASPYKLVGLEVTGKTDKKVTLEKRLPEERQYIKYSLTPNFHMTLTVEQLNSLK